ncbi:transcriptional antiterminator, BglG family [Alkalispirochaeta americana]|uniref:Transcriptional antiterminator, BglG family n=1 Tax=Alkalispirochaeta americana TaxID=159291 RepID=A0A1N6Q7L9_9SPIO|nr:HTH domain-containing protein [Alkalispirochaeta americana]SIQ12537.1 transcriptional antiterminator, BglG family [Alkalispirochaeta americana]
MEDRFPLILQLLSGETDYITIERIAEITGAGVRTIHRDIERLERSLALRGIRLERRRGYGVRLIDALPGDFSPGVADHPARAGVASRRPFLILLYLIASGRWIKISELAHSLMVSDSSVSSDLSVLEPHLAPGVGIGRQKGVGVRLECDEYRARMLFLSVFPRIFPRNLVVRETKRGDYGRVKQERTAAGRLLSSLGIYNPAGQIMRGIAAAEESCGFRFAPSFSSLVYGYMYVVRRRLPELGPVTGIPQSQIETPQLFLDAARIAATAAFGDMLGGPTPGGEIEVLGRLLSAAEAAEIPDIEVSVVTGSIGPGVDAVLERTLTAVEQREHLWLHDDRSLLNYLRMSIAAAVRRVSLGIPRWSEFSNADLVELEQLPNERDDYGLLLDEVLREFGGMLSGAPHLRALLANELGEAGFALSAKLSGLRRRRSADLRVKIMCYEGLGMSSYLAAITRELLPPGALVDTRWAGRLQAEEISTGYDLVISTFPVEIGDTPGIVVTGDTSPQQLRETIAEAVRGLGRRVISPKSSDTPGPASPPGPPKGSGAFDSAALSLPTIMNMVYGFFVAELPANADATVVAVEYLTRRGDCDPQQLQADFERRESYGSLVFEEYNIQILHCRSKGVPEPRAGVLRCGATLPTVLVLVAPPSTPAPQTQVLSELVVALSDHPGFAHHLIHSDRAEIQTALLSLFGRRALLP